MRVFFPVLFSLLSLGLVSWLEILLLKKLHRDWWSHRFVRAGARAVPIAGTLAVLLWTAGIFIDSNIVLLAGAYTASAVLIAGVALLLSLPVSGFVHWVAHAFGRTKEERRTAAAQPEASPRRRFLKTASVIVPAVTLAAGGKGLANSFREPLVREIPIRFPDLPADLEGFRIVHISDVHLGLFVTMHDLEYMMAESSRLRADLVLVTGDYSDDADEYLQALRMAGQIPSRYGIFASLGNHEYFRGIKKILRAYERGPVPLLRSSGASVRVKNTALYIAGADDPRSLGALSQDFFVKTIDAAMDGAPSDAFYLLMSHRPEGFIYAAKRGIHFTLAGHTHGGQIGVGGYPVMELFGRQYMWGLYKNGPSRLYTTAGAGQWFPFRLGCPAEIPVYILRKESGREPVGRETV